MKTTGIPFDVELIDLELDEILFPTTTTELKPIKKEPEIKTEPECVEPHQTKYHIRIYHLPIQKQQKTTVNKKQKRSTLRTHLSKRCGDSNCPLKQHYENSKEADQKKPEILTTGTMNCKCGSPLQFYFMGKFISSSTVSRYMGILTKRNEKSSEEE